MNIALIPQEVLLEDRGRFNIEITARKNVQANLTSKAQLWLTTATARQCSADLTA